VLVLKDMTRSVRHLTTLFAPRSYELALDLSKRSERIFSGTLTLRGELKNKSQEIVLHSKGLEIATATINDKEATYQAGPDDELSVTTNTTLQPGEYTLAFTFSGKITDAMSGLYPCYFKHDGKDKELLMTQLESHYARELFPCIDEPAAKAVFDLALTTEPDVTVLANTPVAKSQGKDGTLVTVFEPTPKMSTYLLAFVVGELGYTEVVNKNGVTVRCYATPDNVPHTKFAVDFGAKILELYDDYFDLPYPLPKCDMVAVPDFAAGAMENWGLITYRENALLYDEKNSDASLKEWVAAVVAHELAHQWFGNLVTMKWWDDLWLNESFAKWMEHYAVDKLVPEWRVWDQFGASERQYAAARDALAGVQAVREKVNHPEELNSLFDPAIVYAKGACLIRMLEGFVGEDVFRDGLRRYMKKHQYSNADADDLWEALDAASKQNVSTFMKRWVEQPGHPVVSVDSSPENVVLQQRRFYANPKQAKDDGVVWPLPLLSDQIKADILDAKEKTFPASSTAARINNGYVGFYHVKYDADALKAIIKEVEAGKLPVVDRQGLLVDAVALAKAGEQSTADAMKLLAAYAHESSYPVWQAMTSVIGAARTIINDDPEIKPSLQRFIAGVADSEYKRLGWERKKGESYFDELLRPTIIGLMAYSEMPEVVDKLLGIFDAAKKPEDIATPELRSIVYSVAVRERGRSAYDKELAWYKTATSAEERTNLIAGMTSMRDTNLAVDATKLFTTKTVRLQDLVYWFIYSIRNRHARPASWQWMVDNWGWIEKQFKNTHDFSDFPKYSAGALATREELTDYKKFFTPMLNDNSIAMVIRQGVEDIETRVLWRERDLEAVRSLLA
jgi:aminopeptidase N